MQRKKPAAESLCSKTISILTKSVETVADESYKKAINHCHGVYAETVKGVDSVLNCATKKIA